MPFSNSETGVDGVLQECPTVKRVVEHELLLFSHISDRNGNYKRLCSQVMPNSETGDIPGFLEAGDGSPTVKRVVYLGEAPKDKTGLKRAERAGIRG